MHLHKMAAEAKKLGFSLVKTEPAASLTISLVARSEVTRDFRIN